VAVNNNGIILTDFLYIRFKHRTFKPFCQDFVVFHLNITVYHKTNPLAMKMFSTAIKSDRIFPVA